MGIMPGCAQVLSYSIISGAEQRIHNRMITRAQPAAHYQAWAPHTLLSFASQDETPSIDSALKTLQDRRKDAAGGWRIFANSIPFQFLSGMRLSSSQSGGITASPQLDRSDPQDHINVMNITLGALTRKGTSSLVSKPTLISLTEDLQASKTWLQNGI